MGSIRSGARSFLNLMAKACKLSKTPGFSLVMAEILGTQVAADFFALWNPLCTFVDALVAADNWFNQKDFKHEAGGGAEDVTLA